MPARNKTKNAAKTKPKQKRQKQKAKATGSKPVISNFAPGADDKKLKL